MLPTLKLCLAFTYRSFLLRPKFLIIMNYLDQNLRKSFTSERAARKAFGRLQATLIWGIGVTLLLAGIMMVRPPPKKVEGKIRKSTSMAQHLSHPLHCINVQLSSFKFIEINWIEKVQHSGPHIRCPTQSRERMEPWDVLPAHGALQHPGTRIVVLRLLI